MPQHSIEPLVAAVAAAFLASWQQPPTAPPPTTAPPSAPAAPDGSKASPLTPTLRWSVPLGSPSFGSAAAADVDGDGRPEIAFGTYFGDGRAVMLNAEDGSLLWSHSFGEACLDASTALFDTDGNGSLELVVPVSNQCLVAFFDAATGRLLGEARMEPGGCIDTPPTIADLGDGELSVLVGTFKGTVHRLRARDRSSLAVFKAAPSFIQSEPALLEIDGDGMLDIVVGNFKGDDALHAVSGRDGRPLWTAPVEGWVYHGPAVADVDGDGHPELAVGSYAGKIFLIDGRDGSRRWAVAPGDRYFMSPTTVADVDGDGKPEVLCASQRVTAIRGDGSILWSVPVDDTGGMESVTRGPVVADMDGDGGPDVLTLNGAGLLRVFRGRDGARIGEFDAAKALGKRVQRASHAPIVIDVDGDGDMEVFVVVGDSSAQPRWGAALCIDGFPGRGPAWTRMRNSPRNDGWCRAPAGPPGADG